MGATSGAGTAYPSGAPEFIPGCLSFCAFSFGHCVFYSSSIYGFWLPPFGIFKLFLCQLKNSQVVKYITLKFGTDYGGKFYFHQLLHEREPFYPPYRITTPLKRIILESKSEMCKWSICFILFI